MSLPWRNNSPSAARGILWEHLALHDAGEESQESALRKNTKNMCKMKYALEYTASHQPSRCNRSHLTAINSGRMTPGIKGAVGMVTTTTSSMCGL